MVRIKVQRDKCNSFVQTKSKEILTLRTSLEYEKKQEVGVLEEIAAIDARN